MKSKKGFTLIELLVVIAIIGILASIVLVSLNGARDRAKDARITAAMSQLRQIAELVSEDNNQSYASLAGSGGNGGCDSAVSSEGATLCADINDLAGSYPTWQADADEYCAYAPLVTTTSGDAAQWYCVDSNGGAGSVTTDPSTTSNCDGTTFTCPSS